MRKHPFEPQISKKSKKLLIGTLPPEGVKFYFSNSSNTRLWDILIAINEGKDVVGKGGNILSDDKKIAILDKLGIGICDIIYEYDRDYMDSTKDTHIDPRSYKDILQLAVDNGISELLFVYQSAYKWFLHSLIEKMPVRLTELKSKHNIGLQQEIEFEEKMIKCILLPSPLNRGRSGETLKFKLNIYREYIVSPTKTEQELNRPELLNMG